MSDTFPVELLLQARDEMSAALNKAVRGLGGFEKGAKDAGAGAKTWNEAAQRWVDGNGRFVKGTEDAARGAKGAGDESEKAGKKMGIFSAGAVAAGNLLSGVVSGAFGALKAQIGGVVSAMIDGNREFETYTTQFSVMLGSVDAAKQRLKELAEFGAKTPFELPEVVRADKILTGFGLTAENVSEKFGFSAQQIRTIAGDVASGAGVSFEEMAGYLGKFSSGATGEAISRFQELGIATREQLAEMGLKFSKSGELLSPLPESMQVVLTLMKQKYGGMMDAQSATFDGMMSNLQDWVKGTLREIGQPIFEKLKDKLGVVLAFLNDPATKAQIMVFAQAMVKFFSDVVAWIEEHWPEIQQTVTDVFTVIKWAWVNILSPILSVLLTVIKGVVEWVRTNWPEIDRVFMAVVDNFRRIWTNQWKPIFDFIGDAIATMIIAFNGIEPNLRATVAWLSNVGRAMLDGIIDGIRQAPGRVEDALRGVVNGAIDAIKRQLGIASPSKVFAAIGRQIPAGLAKGILAGANIPALALSATVAGVTGTGAAQVAKSTTNVFNLNAQYATRQREDLAGDVRLLQMAYGRA